MSDKQGLFQAAEGGTLFLDEVAELPLPMQVKLLRAIQEKAIRPVGEQKEINIDVRVLSATHKDLAKLVEAGEFRQDLYYRINVIELRVPSLRQRREDIPQLAEHILGKLTADQPDYQPRLSEAARAALQRYAFPGNVRELENILERALTLCDNTEIHETDLALPASKSDEALVAESDQPAPPEGVALEDYLEDIERKAILNALEQTHNNKTAAARLLGITFRALRYRLKKLGLE